MRKIIKHFYILISTVILTYSCISKNEKLKNSSNTENLIEYSELIFPNKTLENNLIGKLKYYYELSDTVKTDKEDIRIMTVYAKLSKNKIDPKKLNKIECDSFFSIVNNFKDTLNNPIFFNTENKKGKYFLSGKVIVRSFPRYYEKLDSLNAIIIIREFNFQKNEPIIINEK
ncbi:hypothetical protein BA195_13925 [Tenacibaculum soleae]|uniref:Uncharacterized protein n=1 Tax=Tenacibaculum soleae TaxID=447689 RepID=A0A1B9XYY1_9FLAO|nr:hypothetical protein [Tenacibaculum soleae]OCK42681.1 hypothetical protein BA195_13925 [Tenacibaculum soleae]